MRLAHIYYSSQPVIVLGFEVDVLLLVLFADGAVIAIIADTVHLFERELFILVFISYDSDDDVVVFDGDDFDVKVVPALSRQWFVVEELIGGTMQFLYFVAGGSKFIIVFGSWV